jgi:hypothetical protein
LTVNLEHQTKDNMRTTAKERAEVINRLINLGITYSHAGQLRRIAMTLRNWFERECGSENGDCIERDETTGKPFVTYEAGAGPRKRYPIADKEAGARKRLAAIMAGYRRKLVPYVQGDCRGASLHIIRRKDARGQNLDQVYNRGVAVY